MSKTIAVAHDHQQPHHLLRGGMLLVCHHLHVVDERNKRHKLARERVWLGERASELRTHFFLRLKRRHIPPLRHVPFKREPGGGGRHTVRYEFNRTQPMRLRFDRVQYTQARCWHRLKSKPLDLESRSTILATNHHSAMSMFHACGN